MFIGYFYPDCLWVSSNSCVQSQAHFLLPTELVLTLWNSLLSWTIYHHHGFYVLVPSPTPASYKNPCPTNPHWFHFLLFLDSNYISISTPSMTGPGFSQFSPAWWGSLLTMVSMSVLGSPLSTVHSAARAVSHRQIWRPTYLFNKYFLGTNFEPGIVLGVQDTVYNPYIWGVYSLGLETPEHIKQMNNFKIYKWYNEMKKIIRKHFRKGGQGRCLLRTGWDAGESEINPMCSELTALSQESHRELRVQYKLHLMAYHPWPIASIFLSRLI